MKIFLAIIVSTLLLTQLNNAHAAHLLKQINPILIDAGNFTDLASFGEAIGDKRIVLLDELTHGENEVFTLKSRIVKYLHQQKGFDVLLLESSIFDVNKVWENAQQSINQQAPGNIFYMYVKNPAFKGLLNYIDNQRTNSRPLYLSGFDGRLSGKYSNEGVVSFIEKTTKKHLEEKINVFDWQTFKQLSQKLLTNNIQDISEQEKIR